MGSGTHISTGIGPSFQHGRLQRLLDGSRNICTVTVYLESDFDDVTSVNYDGARELKLSDILENSYCEVNELLVQNDVPTIQTRISRTEADVSRLMVAFEIAVMEIGERRDIDVFTQDAVDNVKSRLRESF